METRARELVEQAQEHREESALKKAGDLYTAAAHEFAGTVTHHTFPTPDGTNGAISRLRYAATCYRIEQEVFRTQNRCDLGVLLAEDYIEYIDGQEFETGSFADLRRGAWHEYIGDLCTIARRDDAADAYERAVEIYRSAGDSELAYAEQEHMRLTGFYRALRRGLGHDIPDTAPEQQSLEVTFTEWIEYKRERLPDLLDELEAQGAWPIDKS